MDTKNNNDYLWNGSGEPDPEVRRLETMLGGLRHARPAPDFTAIARAEQRSWRPRFLALPWLRFATGVATMLLIAAAGIIWLRSKPNTLSQTAWEVSRVEGSPRVGAQTLHGAGGKGKLDVGQILETDSVSKAGISDEQVGEIEIEPDTRLRLLASRSGARRLSLERGTIHASIWAPAGEFVVDTPSAVAVDLGCVYTLHVDDSGDGQLHTTLGWVGFKLGDRESFIPAGAACATRKNRGPGIPYFEDASNTFRAALTTLDLESSTSRERSAALRVALGTSRQRDAFTLWHLFSRVPDSERGAVFDRLTALVPAPPGVTREGIVRLDRTMLDLWWDQFGLGDVKLWRHWERSWPDQAVSK